jgi:hypothetical protein
MRNRLGAHIYQYSWSMVFQEYVMSTPRITQIGGPTVLIEVGGFRLLTDPTFDAPGEY